MPRGVGVRVPPSPYQGDRGHTVRASVAPTWNGIHCRPTRYEEMTRDIASLRDMVGCKAPPVEYLIDPGSIKYYADSLMDYDPRWIQTAPSGREDGRGLSAPATFFGSATGLRNLPAGDARTMSALDLPLPSGWATLATGDEFEFHSPVTAGMTLVAQERLIDVYEKRGRSGELIFYTIEKSFHSSDGVLVLRRILHCAAREPVPFPSGHSGQRRVLTPPPLGELLPPLSVGPITVRHLAMFASATAEFVDIHYDADYARSVGLPGPIIQGLYKTALISRMLKDWTGDPALIRNLNVRHHGMDTAGSTLTVGGTVGPYDEASNTISCHVWVRNQDEMVTTSGTARVNRPLSAATEYP